MKFRKCLLLCSIITCAFTHLHCASLNIDPVNSGDAPSEHLRIPLDLSVITTLAVSSDGSLLAAGKNRGTLSVWNLKAGELLFSGNISSAGIGTILISPDNSFLVLSLEEGSVLLWDIRSKRVRRKIIEEDRGTSCCCIDMFRYSRSFKPKISTLSFIMHEKLLFVGRKNGIFEQYPLDETATIPARRYNDLNCLQSSSSTGKKPDIVLSGCRFYSRTVTVYKDHYSEKEKIDPDGDLATHLYDSALKVERTYRTQEWYIGTLKLVSSIPGFVTRTFREDGDINNPSTISAAAILPGGNSIIAITRYDKKGASIIRLYDRDLAIKSTIDYPGDHDSSWLTVPSSVSCSKSGEVIACTGSRGVVHIVSVQENSLKKVRDIRVCKGCCISAAVLSSNGKFLFTGNGSSPAIDMFQVSDGKKIATLVSGDNSDWIIHSSTGLIDGKGNIFNKSVMIVHGKEIPIPRRAEGSLRSGLLRELAGKNR